MARQVRNPATQSLRSALRSKAAVFMGEDTCRFRMASGGGRGAAQETFIAVRSDRLVRNLGQVATLGMGGLFRQPLQQFRLVGVDAETLDALRRVCAGRGATFNMVMVFLELRGYAQYMEATGRKLGWRSTVAFMRREGAGPAGREPLQTGLRAGEVAI
ncbi:unnamed protein product [Ostreobium quekettii]|uniref:Uncharacterized protein n=1 Tax=Ostreobium quekettii TaxID=121088 RepID=A0A8S1IZZ8_9CHLO|nr:unnamed protein product [Ostreobium quekettii]